MLIYPDYERSVVNVASSMIAAFGGSPTYAPLKELDFIRGYQKVVLVSIDGLGYEFLQKYGKGSFLLEHCIAKITSTFPSTTAAAEMALETGVAPQQHGITGWYMYLKELGTVSRALLFEPRWGKSKFADAGIKYEIIFTEKKTCQKINSPYSFVMPEIILDTYKPIDKNNLLPYANLDGMADQIKKAVDIPGKRFIFSYWLELDSICHDKGCESREAADHFRKIDRAVSDLADYFAARDCCLIVTADHGLTDIPEKNRIILNQDFPEIYDCLVLPLCGDTRAPYCYVRPDSVVKFKKLVRRNLGFCCDLHKSIDFVKKGAFGLGRANPKLYERIGDYILVCKEGYLIRDYLAGEKISRMKGFHGGMSKDEMYVPLIVSR